MAGRQLSLANVLWGTGGRWRTQAGGHSAGRAGGKGGPATGAAERLGANHIKYSRLVRGGNGGLLWEMQFLCSQVHPRNPITSTDLQIFINNGRHLSKIH